MKARLLAAMWCVAAVSACGSSLKPLQPSLPPRPEPAPVAATPSPITPSVITPAPAPIPTTTVAPPADAPRVQQGDRGNENDLAVRVALATSQQSVQLASSGAWALYDRTGEHLLSTLAGGDQVSVEACGGMICAQGANGDRIPAISGPLVARAADESAILSYNGKRYRGELLVATQGGGIVVINRLSIESYLRGVVPLEIGSDRTMGEEAAVEAQAIAARSYAYKRLDESRVYDVTATVMDQVYGGMDAERTISDTAIQATRDMVLMYDGKVVDAPYHSTSGGVTAAASEVWNTTDEPYLASVSDRIPGSDHYYDELSPRFHWTRTFDEPALEAALNKYLPKYTNVPSGGIGRIRDIHETGRTPSGRIAGVTIVADRGSFTVLRNNVRFVLRTSAGDLLPSTLFTIQAMTDGDGYVQRVTIQGSGSGHGVGMDQWGAIGRARAGQDCLTILRTYYPGTTVGRII